MWYKKLENKQLKHLKEVRNKLGLSSYPINKHWRKEWAPFVKHDFDWDSEFLLNIMIYKIEKMKMHLEMLFSGEDKESLNKVLVTMQDALNVGYAIKEDNYDSEADKFDSEHFYWIESVINNSDTYNPSAKILFTVKKLIPFNDNNNNDAYWLKRRLEMIDECEDWQKEHKCKKTTTLVSNGVWDDKKNKEKYELMRDDARREKEKDIQLFFAIISKNYNSWSEIL